MPENKEWTMTFTSVDINKDAAEAVTGIDPEKDDSQEELETLREENEKLRAKLAHAEKTIHESEHYIQRLQSDLAEKTGMINGLKFAIRCDGVSGADVR